MRRQDFSYELPEELIAQSPLAERSASRLLVLDGASGALADRRMEDLPAYLRAGDLLIFNDTRVVAARIVGSKPSGGRVEIFLERVVADPGAGEARAGETGIGQARPGEGSPNEAGRETGSGQVGVGEGSPNEAARVPGTGQIGAGEVGANAAGRVSVLHQHGKQALVQLRASKPIREGLEIATPGGVVRVLARDEDLWRVEVPGDALEFFETWGEVPLPPYIHRAAGEQDRERYQSIFAREKGAVAAPTASLHFDARLIARLDAIGVERAFVTLHVGAGTFQPLRADNLDEHKMHAERVSVSRATWDAIQRTRARGGRVVAVGTTVVRALESAAASLSLMALPPPRIGVRAANAEPSAGTNERAGAEGYMGPEGDPAAARTSSGASPAAAAVESAATVDAAAAVKASATLGAAATVGAPASVEAATPVAAPATPATADTPAWSGETRLFIRPGFKFRVVDAMVTNFHLPESTLLMLVSAFAGRENVLAAYAHAVRARYRFFSYGDAMLVMPT